MTKAEAIEKLPTERAKTRFRRLAVWCDATQNWCNFNCDYWHDVGVMVTGESLEVHTFIPGHCANPTRREEEASL